jgi:hypothetical protein
MSCPERIEVRGLSNGWYVAKGEVYPSLDDCLDQMAHLYPAHRSLSLKRADAATDAYWRQKIRERSGVPA